MQANSQTDGLDGAIWFIANQNSEICLLVNNIVWHRRVQAAALRDRRSLARSGRNPSHAGRRSLRSADLRKPVKGRKRASAFDAVRGVRKSLLFKPVVGFWDFENGKCSERFPGERTILKLPFAEHTKLISKPQRKPSSFCNKPKRVHGLFKLVCVWHTQRPLVRSMCGLERRRRKSRYGRG